MEYISYFLIVQICFSQTIIVNAFVLTDSRIEHHAVDNSTKFEEIQSMNKSRRSLATNDNNELWDEGIISYEIDESYTGQQRKLIKQAMRHWEQSTCLQFVPRNRGLDEHYILFAKISCGCCSFVGKQRFKMQILSMADNCMSLGTLLHELGHAIGFFHEHRRPDRDDYVEVIRDNIMAGEERNFDKASKDESTTSGQAYDYSSIMHYSSNGSSKRPYLNVLQPLIKINGELPILGQRNGLSQGDIMTANLLYHCQQCGGTLFEPKGIFSPLTQRGPLGTQRDVEHCQWTIRAPEGHRIKLSIKSLNIHESIDCSMNYLEIRNGSGKNNGVIAHYCGKYETTLTVNSNIAQILSVRTQVEYDKPSFLIEYEAVCSNDIYIEHNDTYYVESPNYPEQYGPNKLCYWYITAPEDHFIYIKFYDFELQDSPHCESDVLEVREGDNFQAPISRVYCGIIDNLKIASTGRFMLLKFFTDESDNGNGFSAVITARPKNYHN